MNSKAVCILTAGSGTRMGALGKCLNKALFPLAKKAAISHIIEKFPTDTEFVIGLGYLAEQVRTYLRIAHPETKFILVDIENWQGAGSGPGHSLYCCREHLQRPFYFISCDTIWEGDLPLFTDRDWLGVGEVPEEESQHFCNFQIENGRVVAIKDKQRVPSLNHKAFVGLCFIKNFEVFWAGLSRKDVVAGELQVSNGNRALVEKFQPEALPIAWIDTGDEKRYLKAVSHFENYNFSKFDEALYILNGRVIKWFADPVFAERRTKRAAMNPEVFPHIEECHEGFYWYKMAPGDTFYALGRPALFLPLLQWLDKKLWLEKKVAPAEIRSLCEDFHHKKTLNRIAKYLRKYPDADAIGTINMQEVPSLPELFEKVPWERIYDGKAVFAHGDIHFDNMVVSPDRKTFTLLDWRQDFGGRLEYGDLYYDLAKILGGILLNYDFIKMNLFRYEENEDGIFFDFARRTQAQVYEQIFEKFATSRGLDWQKVKILVPIIYLNMAPLHHYPFDKFLYALGKSMLHAELQNGS